MDQYELIRTAARVYQKSIRQIAQETGHTRRTIRKVLAGYEPKYRRRHDPACRVMDLHHLLPLSSGTRVEAEGTTLDDLVPVCPSCHRAVHRFYDGWLIGNGREDFTNGNEAHEVYRVMKTEFPGLIQNA